MPPEKTPNATQQLTENGTSWQAQFCTTIYLSATYSIKPLPSLMKKHGTWHGAVEEDIAIYN